MSILAPPYVMEERRNYKEYLDQLLDEEGCFDPNQIAVMISVVERQSVRRRDDFALKSWISGRGAPIYNRELKVGDKVVKNKINNKIQINMPKRLVKIRAGYLGGSPVKYTIDSDYYDGYPNSEDAIERAFQILDKFKRNSKLGSLHNETIKSCTAYGQAGRLMYAGVTPFNTEEAQLLCMFVPGYDCFFIYSEEWWRPELSIRYITDDGKSFDVYDKKRVTKIRDGKVSEVQDHLMGWNPLIPYFNNSDAQGNIDDCFSKVNDLDEQRSNLSSLFTSQRLILKIFQDVDVNEEEVDNTIQNGYIKLTTDENGNGKVYFEELRIDSAPVETHIEKIEAAIYKDATVVNLEDKTFGNESGEAKKFYLTTMESDCLETENSVMTSDAIMISVLANWYNRQNTQEVLVPESVKMSWSRNLPNSWKDEVDNFAKVWNKVPGERAYELLSFIDDPSSEYAKFTEEQEALYGPGPV